MKEMMIKRLEKLLSVKSLVTLALTAVFVVMALRNTISQEFLTVYTVVIAFYFGTQSQKVLEASKASAGTNRSSDEEGKETRESPGPEEE